jgi:hypothetical protein
MKRSESTATSTDLAVDINSLHGSSAYASTVADGSVRRGAAAAPDAGGAAARAGAATAAAGAAGRTVTGAKVLGDDEEAPTGSPKKLNRRRWHLDPEKRDKLLLRKFPVRTYLTSSPPYTLLATCSQPPTRPPTPPNQPRHQGAKIPESLLCIAVGLIMYFAVPRPAALSTNAW